MCWDRCVAVGVLALVLTVDRASAAPRLVCSTVKPGDTAAKLAVRLTNDARSRHESWFQILDPATARVVPKTRYRRIQPGWQACIANEVVAQPYAIRQPASVAEPLTAQLSAMIVDVGFWWVPILVMATALMWGTVQNYIDRRSATWLALESFGNVFVREFEGPLIQQPCRESPVRSRLHVIPERRRLEILLAPSEGRRYPNLTDHRQNVEYDVDRVVTVVGDARFVRGELAVQGPWVVIPFRLETAMKKDGRT